MFINRYKNKLTSSSVLDNVELKMKKFCTVTLVGIFKTVDPCVTYYNARINN